MKCVAIKNDESFYIIESTYLTCGSASPGSSRFSLSSFLRFVLVGLDEPTFVEIGKDCRIILGVVGDKFFTEGDGLLAGGGGGDERLLSFEPVF